MERGRVTKREALLELSELQEELDRLDRQIERPSLKTARETARQIGERGREEMAKRAEELAERARQQGKEELEKQMREAAEQARKAATAREMRKLGAKLERAAERTGTTLAPTAALDAVSVALENENWDEVLNSLEDLQQMLSGGDVELTKEQAEELAKRLEELAEKLKDTDLEELSECLNKAAECMKKGDCKGAAACLGAGTRAGRSGLGAARLGKGLSEMRAAADAAAANLRRPTGGGGSGRGIGPDSGSQQQVAPNAEGASLYAPRENPMDATPEQVRTGVRPGGEAHATPTRGAPDRVDPSRVPYYEVIGDYSRAAEDALEREEVPPAYRGTVREYFESLQGGDTAGNGSADQPTAANDSDG
jgi:hypothetical protein